MRAQAVIGKDSRLLDNHLRFPRFSNGPLVGSQEGAVLWAEVTGQRLIEALLKDDLCRQWYAPPPESNLLELQGRVASLVAESASVESLEEWLPLQVEALMADLRSSQVMAQAVWFVAGIECPDGPLFVENWCCVAPITELERNQLLQFMPRGAIGVPRDTATLLGATGIGSREDMPSSAVTAANVAAHLALHGLVRAIWLATGVLAVRVGSASFDISRFRSLGLQNDSHSFERVHRRYEPGPVRSNDVGAIQKMRRRLYHLHDVSWPDDSGDRLATALRLADAALESPDGAVTALATYAAIDGLLSVRGEDDSMARRRAAILFGADTAGQRLLRSRLEALYRVRGDIAHGRPISQSSVRAMSGLSEADDSDPFEQPRAEEALKLISLRLLRIVLALLLDVTTAEEDDAIVPAEDLTSIRGLLDLALANDQVARGKIAQWQTNWANRFDVFSPPVSTRFDSRSNASSAL